jgi:hypothetical protein
MFMCEPCILLVDLILELAEGYVNALEISTSPSPTMREVFGHYGRMTLYENGTRGGKDQASRKWCDEVSNDRPTLQTIFPGTLRSERRHVKNEAGQVRASNEAEAVARWRN